MSGNVRGAARADIKSQQLSRVLVIVPCGSLKIWDKRPSAGPTRAADAYIGPLFSRNKAYAERFSTDWIILSAKYGLISPGFLIPESCNVTFKKRSTDPIAIDDVVRQAQDIDVRKYDVVIGLGGIDYSKVTKAAFTSSHVEFPFLGLKPGIGTMMRAINHAIDTGEMCPPS